MKNENLEKKLNSDSKPEKHEKLKSFIYKKSMNFIEKKFNELVVEGKENIPKDDYIIFAGNHAKLFDPLVFYYLIENIPMIARDDFLDGFPFKLKIFGKGRDLNSLLNDFLSWEFNSVPITRGGIKPSQTKKCIKKFEENKKICFFPMGTRTTSGSIYEMYESSDKKNPGKFVYGLQRSAGKPVNIVPFSLSYDRIAKIVTLTIGKSYNLNTSSLKSLSQKEQNIFYEKITDDMIRNIGNLTKVYGDSILATIIKSETSNLEEKEYRWYLKKDLFSEVFNSVVEKLNSSKKINLDKRLLGDWYSANYLNQFFSWAEKKMQFVGSGLSGDYLLHLDNIRKEPRKRIFKEDANTSYFDNESKHLTLLQEIVTKEINESEYPLIYSEKIHRIRSRASKPLP